MRRALAVSALLLAAAASDDEAPRFDDAELRQVLAMSPLGAPPPDPTNRVADDERAAHLGQRLFFDAGLSRNGEISCATCHDPDKALSDAKALSEGLGTTSRRSPSLWNVAHQRWLFWDGRADTLWCQALQPIESELEMGGDRVAVVRHVAMSPELRSTYVELFGDLPALEDADRFPANAKPMPDAPDDPRARAWAAMTEADRFAIDRAYAQVGKAIAAYERKLLLAPSPFDRFVEGLREDDAEKLGALAPAAQRGLRLFLGKAGCRTCHLGALIGDGEFHAIPLPTPDGGLPRDAGRYEGVRRLRADRFNAAGPHSDAAELGAQRLRELAEGPESWGEFRTPSLRGVTSRGPFMHAGQFATLREVLDFYSTLEGASVSHAHQETVLVATNLDRRELEDLTAFLESLDAEPLEPAWLQSPATAGGR